MKYIAIYHKQEMAESMESVCRTVLFGQRANIP